MTVTEYYNEVNKKMTLLINKTIMTYRKDKVITKETNKTVRSSALRIFFIAIPTPPQLFPIPTEGRRKYDTFVIVIIVIPFEFY